MAETAEERKKRVDAFKEDVKKIKPKDMELPSPGLEEDKTPGPAAPIKKAKGGGLGCGAAMRGYGAVRKK